MKTLALAGRGIQCCEDMLLKTTHDKVARDTANAFVRNLNSAMHCLCAYAADPTG